MLNRRAVLLTLGVLPLGLGGCRSCLPRSDAERAAEERAKTNQRLESALALVPYRVLKLTLRTLHVTPPPPALAEIAKLVAGLDFERAKTDWASQTRELIAVVAALYRARSILTTADEDDFPLLWEAMVGPQRPALWYDKPAEHLLLGTALMAVDIALNKDPLTDILIYELSRAPAQQEWPPELKVWALLARGLLYLLNGSHYAAEEELTKYLATVPELGPATWQSLQKPSGERGLADLPLLMLVNQTPIFLTAGYLLRAINRFALHRSELAYQDLEAMLKQLAGAGIDNELSQWGWAMVHIHQKRPEEAAADLARLAQSPYLSDADRTEVRTCSEQLRGLHQGFVLFGTQRAQLVIVRALIARAGGVQHILTQLLGAERATQVYAPVAFLSAVSAELPKSAQDALKQGQDLSSKGLNFLRERLK